MGSTISEKILAAHSGQGQVRAGEFISAGVDLALANDITAPLCINEFRKMEAGKVWDPEKVVLVPDHNTPNKDIASAQNAKTMREFAREQGITNIFEVGRAGIAHALLPERGLVVPGDLVVGADSHTCTYGALGAFSTGVGSTDLAAVLALGECWLRVPATIKLTYNGQLNEWVGGKDLILFTIGKMGVSGGLYRVLTFVGEAIQNLPMADRFTIANMVVETGAKAGMIPVDDVTLEYVDQRAKRPCQVYRDDPDCAYERETLFEVGDLEPQVALPHLPENAVPVSKAPPVPIDQVVIGSCTNGHIEDLRVAAKILRGRRCAPGLRCIVIPATQETYLEADREGLLAIFVEAEAVVSAPTCGPCLGAHMGVLAEGERCVSTTNRNFVGRMGHPKSEVYLASPAVAAATAVAGRIVHPEELPSL